MRYSGQSLGGWSLGEEVGEAQLLEDSAGAGPNVGEAHVLVLTLEFMLDFQQERDAGRVNECQFRTIHAQGCGSSLDECV